MHSLISYSADHFDPGIPVERHAHWGSSPNVISRTLHAALAKRGEVTFIDATEPGRLAGRAFDVLIGIQRNFGAILERCAAERSVLVAVNMHPAEHNELLLDFVVREELPTSALHALDFHDVDQRSRDLDSADSILLFGNGRTLDSYTDNGVPREKIRLVNYGVDVGVERSADPAGETQVLYCASEIGLRKGFDIVAGLAEDVDLAQLGAHLHIAGAPSYPHYRERLDQLDARLGSRVTNHGWLDPSSAEYRELLESCDYLLFPSLEEGQAGTVLDAMACGVIPLISANCGVDFAPLGFCELRIRSARNRELLRRACALPQSARRRLRSETLEYYEEFHAGFEPELETALHDLLESSAAGGPHRGPASEPEASAGDPVSLGKGPPHLRQRIRLRWLVARLRWFNSWKLHQALGRVRRRLPV